MNTPRFSIQTIMIVVAVVAVGLRIARWNESLGIVYAVAVLGLAIPVTTESGGAGWRLRRDVRRVWLCYLAGALGPTICLLFDPFVFRESGLVRGRAEFRLLFRPFFYAFMTISMVLLTLWLRLGSASNPLAGLLSGALWTGAFFAFALGLLLWPLSIIGLFALIGALGFTPFATAYAFSVEARHAAECSALGAERGHVVALQVTGGMLLVICSASVQVFVWRLAY